MAVKMVARQLAQPLRALSRHWNSVAFRLTLSYGLLTILTTLIVLLFIYTQVVGVLRTQQANQILHAEQRLINLYETVGIPAVATAIDRAIADELDGGEDLYLLTDGNGVSLAGNIETLENYAAYGGMFEMEVFLNDRLIDGHFRQRNLPDGYVLLIGLEARKINRVTDMILQGIGATVGLALLLVILGSYIFRREFERRVGPLRTTARQIGPGKLSLRIPQSQESDEFSHLNHDVNAMLDRIERLMRGVRDVSDAIAHDLRTPLMRMQARLRSVQHADATQAELSEAVDGMADEIDRLNALLGRLLQISELEAGVGREAFISCRLDNIAADVVDLYSALAEERNINLALHAPDPCSVHGDTQLLANACANIIDNALKYAATAVRVTVENTEEGVLLSVEDDGPGIPAEDRERLGERFYRPNTAREGLGLGLASVKAIVYLHNGKLHFSTGLGDADTLGLAVQLLFPHRS